MTDSLPTIFDAETCTKTGLCPVAQGRAAATHNLYYEIHGQDGTDKAAIRLLFIMGLNNSCFWWIDQIKHFANMPGYLSLVIDNRGVGNSDTPRGRYTTSEMAKDIVDILDHVKWTDKRSVICIGVSMGGLIAQEVALLVPDRLKAIVLTSTSYTNILQRSGVLALAQFAYAQSRGEEALAITIMQALFPREYLDAPDPERPGQINAVKMLTVVTHQIKTARQQTVRGSLSQLAAAITHNTNPDQFKRISESVPKVVIVTGDADDLVSYEHSLKMRDWISGSEYVMFEGGGHAIPMQFCDRFNALLERVAREGAQGG